MSEDVGSLTDELRKLGIALGRLDEPHDHDSAQDDGGVQDHDHAAGDGPDDSGRSADTGTGSSSADDQPMACRYCPVCQLIALAKGQRTDSLDTLVSAATGLVSALTSYVEQKAQQDRPSSSASTDGDDGGEPRVERIDVQ